MAIVNEVEGTVRVDLPPHPEVGQELERLVESARHQNDRDVILGFSKVDFLNSRHLAMLIWLQEVLRKSGHKLLLSNVPTQIMSILSVTRLDEVLEVAGDATPLA